MTKQEILVGKFDITDIDLDYYYSEELDQNGDQIRLDIRTSNDVSYTSCPPADINDVINNLLELKNKGAQRVYIAEHCDHHGYYFYGIKLDDYVPVKTNAWKCIKSFPGSNEGDIYIFDSDRNKFYLDSKRNFVDFKDFNKYPDFFEKIVVSI